MKNRNVILANFAAAQSMAAAIVSAYRAEAPEGFDPQNVAACRPFDIMKTQTESLPQNLLRKPSYMDVWDGVVPRSKYPQGTGVTQTVITIGNSEPGLADEQWNAVTLTGQQITINNDANSSACDNTYVDTFVGFDEITYGPRRIQLRGPVICERALTYHYQVTQFLNAYEQELLKRSKRTWNQEMQNRYAYFSQKYVDGAPVNGDGATSTNLSDTITTLPTSQLTWDMLDSVASILISQEGATQPDSTGYVNLGENGPLFTLAIGVEMANRLKFNSPERRIDLRYGDPKSLLTRVGATATFGNFRFLPETHPIRFIVVNGALRRVPPKIMVNATHGMKAVDNPAYLSAEFEAAIVMIPQVFEAEIVVPNNGTPWAKFQPHSYNGDWEFITGAYRLGIDCPDPKDELGRHFAAYEYAPKPLFPEYGKVLIYKRCQQVIEKVTCNS